jgi:DNA-directed RNA polymerase III subunit RPC1
MLINSELPLPPTVQPSKPIRGLCQRLKGKSGRFRGNLSGKRVDFSGRTVISPDPNLRIDQVAVPEIVAMILTYPEKVTAHNLQKMRQLVLNGANVHPGANFVVHADGTKSFLKFGDRARVAGELRIGDTIERHLADGDLVLFNRQPSLHRISIMCHKAKIMPWRTFRFNECVCTPYNADFDGDEMNLHVPQTEEARAEALTLMGVVHNLITPRTGEPIIAATQDFLTTGYLVSMKDTFYDRSQFAAICTYAFDAKTHVDIPPPAIVKPMQLWTGKQVFSVLIKPNKKSRIRINVEMISKSYSNDLWMCHKDGYVCIQNSELLCGVMDKVSLGGGSKTNIFHIIMRDYSPDEAAECMTRLSKLSARWIGNRGFSIGISDVMPSVAVRNDKEKLVSQGYGKCNSFIVEYEEGKLQPQPGCSAEQTLEAKLNGELSAIREDAGKSCLKTLHHLNSPLIMAVCGSKGSTINISQMIACVGQQTVSGSRIPNGFLNRSLPHFEVGSKAPAAKGFVKHSFYDGLSPTEFFFHTMGGREGLVDTAVKTAETGYMQRRLMKALEDLSTQYDNTVRNSSGDIVQFVYGDDELDPSGMEAVGKPVDFDRIMLHVKSVHPAMDEQHLLPTDILDAVDSQLASHRFAECSSLFKDEIRSFFKKNAEVLVQRRRFLGFPTTMSSSFQNEIEYERKSPAEAKAFLNLHRLTASQITLFLDTCLKKYRKATIEPGSAVGALAAQSIGEPGTQMTLKTFHFAGVASMNITQGVPRIKEIINAAKNISTPVITATLVNDKDIEDARKVKGRIERTTIGEVRPYLYSVTNYKIAKYIKEVFRPAGSYLSVKMDKDCIQALQLEVTIETIRFAILSEKKLKLKDKVCFIYT